MTHEDNHSLLEWLRGKELEAHNIHHMGRCIDCDIFRECTADGAGFIQPCQKDGMEKAFREVITHIENNPKELHRCLIPAGWDTIDP